MGVAPQGKSNSLQVGIQHMPEPVTTRNGVRRWLKNLTRTVGDKISVKIHENGNGAKRTHPNGKRDLYLRKHTADAAAKNGAHEKRQLDSSVTKKTMQKQNKDRLFSRSARCADNHRGERCCDHASMRCRKKLLARVLCSARMTLGCVI